MLPIFDKEKHYTEQNNFYNEKFNIFAEKLIHKLEECKDESFLDGQKAFDIFKKLINFTKDQKLNEVALSARENSKHSAYERYCQQIINGIVDDGLKEIDNIHSQILFNTKNKGHVELLAYNKDSLIKDIKNKMNKEIPKIVQKDPIYIKFEKDVEDKLLSQFKIYEEQIIPQIIIQEAKQKLRDVVENMNEQMKIYGNPNLIFSKNPKDTIQENVFSIINKNYEKFIINNEIKEKIKEEVISLFQNEFTKIQKSIYEFYDKEIEKIILEIERELNTQFTKNINRINEENCFHCNFLFDFDDFSKDFKTRIKNIPNFKYVPPNFEILEKKVNLGIFNVAPGFECI